MRLAQGREADNAVALCNHGTLQPTRPCITLTYMSDVDHCTVLAHGPRVPPSTKGSTRSASESFQSQPWERLRG